MNNIEYWRVVWGRCILLKIFKGKVFDMMIGFGKWICKSFKELMFSGRCEEMVEFIIVYCSILVIVLGFYFYSVKGFKFI